VRPKIGGRLPRGVGRGRGLGGSASYDGLPGSRRPHLWVQGVDELLAMLQESW